MKSKQLPRLFSAVYKATSNDCYRDLGFAAHPITRSVAGTRVLRRRDAMIGCYESNKLRCACWILHLFMNYVIASIIVVCSLMLWPDVANATNQTVFNFFTFGGLFLVAHYILTTTKTETEGQTGDQ